MNNLTLGIAGTAKNTGKTTATMLLLDHFHSLGISLGITSIGYDGESVDNVTGLPKPRIYLKKGDLAAVAEGCLRVSSARVRVLERTDIPTPLGKIVCGRVVQEGLLVVAGPNQSRHLGLIREWMSLQGAGLVIVDGALNRIAPMVETQGFILSTGAAYTTDVGRLALETRSIEVVCNRPGVLEVPEAAGTPGRTVLWGSGGEVLADLPPSLFDPAVLKNISGLFREAAGFYCPGVVSGRCLDLLGEIPAAEGMRYVFRDPVKIMVGGDVAAACRFIERAMGKGAGVGYRLPLPLIAVTVNPFYPCYRFSTHDYQPAFVDRDLLLAKIRASVSVPVHDVAREGPEGLAGAIEAFSTHSRPCASGT